MNKVEIGMRIKTRRLALGLTQSDIYNKTGISTGNLSDIERGKSAPSAAALYGLSQVLDCSTDYILFGHSRESDIVEISDSRETLSPIQEQILSALNKLDLIEQEEVLDIIHVKIRRKMHLVKSSNSSNSGTIEAV